MKKKKEKFSDAIFLVTQEESCPYYDLGDELKVEKSSISVSSFKPVCLHLSKKVEEIVSANESFNHFPKLGAPKGISVQQKSKYDCGGCSGSIRFEFKQQKEYATLQMKLLKESDAQRKRQHLRRYYGVLRKMDLFKSLENESLRELILYLEFKNVLQDKVLIKKGDAGNYLHIVLEGRVALVDEHNQKIAELSGGEIFGQLSLLSGEPETHSYHTVSGTQVAMLSSKNFRHILKKHPALQIFLFKLLIHHVQAMALRSGNIASGMTGDLEEVGVVDLLQLINSAQKTGVTEFIVHEKKAHVYFNEGEIVHAEFNELQGKEAVFALLGLKKGQFSYSRGIPGDVQELPPIGGFIGLIMEGVQLIDEQDQ
ncbi:MAG: DUF4388 domain-containing protein [Desulforhopalus sp.]